MAFLNSLEPYVSLFLAQTRPSGLLTGFFDLIEPLVLLKYAGKTALAVTFGIIVYRVGLRGLRVLQRRGTISLPLLYVLRQALRWTASILILLLVLQALNVLENTWAAMTTVLGLVAVGFVAVWSVLSNALCAMLLVVARPFEIGDWIEIPGEPGEIRGKVTDFNLLYSTLRDGHMIVQVPNNVFFQRPLRRKPGNGQITLDNHLMRKSTAGGMTASKSQPGA